MTTVPESVTSYLAEAGVDSSPIPTIRPRRLRSTPAMRALVRETHVDPAKLIWPVFVRDDIDEPREIAAMPGQYQHTIDAKGRLFIPAKLREELGETFYVTMGMDSCLSVYSDASWARFTEKFESLPYTKTKAMRPLFANAAKCEPDAQGRIVLPQKLRSYAHLEKDVVVIGVSNRAEIWNAEKWAEIEAEELNPENLAAVMEELGF